MMFPSETEGHRLERLRGGYRSAFREWVFAHDLLQAVGPASNAESQAHEHAAAAAFAYRNARNRLTDAMLGRSGLP